MPNKEVPWPITEEMRVRIAKVDMERAEVYFETSIKDLTEFKSIAADQWLQGIVISVRSFGLLVKVRPPSGGDMQQGIVIPSEVVHDFWNITLNKVEVGQEVAVRVIQVDVDAGRMSFSMKSPEVLECFQGLGDKWLDGIVAGVQNFGLFVRVQSPGRGEYVKGFVPKSEIRQGTVSDAEMQANVGDRVKVRVLRLDVDKSKLYLSMIDQISLSCFDGVPPDTWLQGNVSGIHKYGLQVNVIPPSGGRHFEGIVPAGEIRRGFVDNPEEEAEIGQEVKVRILDIDAKRGRLELSMKPRPDLSGFIGIPTTDWLQGVVTGANERGVVVLLPSPGGGESQYGLIPMGQVRQGRSTSLEDAVRVGTQVKVRILNVNNDMGKLLLSMLDAKEKRTPFPDR